jgi:hypothetical protein
MRVKGIHMVCTCGRQVGILIAALGVCGGASLQDNCPRNHHGSRHSLSERLHVPSVQKLASSKPRSGYPPRGASKYSTIGL